MPMAWPFLEVTLTYREETGAFELGDKKPCLDCKKFRGWV